jgi:hypothetical protein
VDKRIARVFPRKTAATPDDELAFVGPPPTGRLKSDWFDYGLELDEVHISVAFMEDRSVAEALAQDWKHFAHKLVIGGPAYDDPGGDFVPGMYVKKGYVVTSRGCPNRCWFCKVPQREGREMRELPITEGWNVLDSNILACSHEHFKAVCEMLKRQPRKADFTGGLEAARLKWWHVEQLWHLRPNQMFFAYDTQDDLEPLVEAGNMLRKADFTRRHMRCYVLIGYPKDTLSHAEDRLVDAWRAGYMPMAMLWSGKDGQTQGKEWKTLQREWARPAITRNVVRDLLCEGS